MQQILILKTYKKWTNISSVHYERENQTENDEDNADIFQEAFSVEAPSEDISKSFPSLAFTSRYKLSTTSGN